jgi:plasmid stabilization system protein ParE
MAARSIRITRRAARQIEEAADWWAANRASAPDAIAEELEQAYSVIAMHPGIGSVARSSALHGVRRILLNRITYYLYYREAGDRIDVLAFWHASRGSGPPL